ncbi:ABC transporter substrate-binding protein [Imbroritus primus]|uniref:ABC transporter substrate-binding protein n=1 Tax=Imbroritus primus TaxID=3058603 RepID=A0ACD3SST6_9BURK|nr:ABC transporter substrate-binding protein [Burkholderiaceae bacterium PBA]
MLKKLLAPLLASLLTLVAVGAAAAPQDATTPDGLVKSLVNDVMTSVKADKDIQAGNVPKIIALVDQKIVPYANFQKTTQLVMGRAWSQATPQQQAQITDEFKKLLVRTYAGAISQIRDQTVQYRPFRAAPEDTDVVVRTQVINNGEPIQLDYRLEKTAAGWKVYDINVLGAWLIEAYRSQFSQMISQQGIDGLLKFLQDRNRQLAAAKS